MSRPEGFGAGYEENYQRHLKERIAIPRDRHGNPNWEVFPVAEALENNLEQYPWFGCLLINGSAMGGYYKREPREGIESRKYDEPSDIDFIIFYDLDKPIKVGGQEVFESPADKINAIQKIVEETRDMVVTQSEKATEMGSPSPLRPVIFSYVDISSKAIEEDILTMKGSKFKLKPFGVWNIFGPVKGPRVATYRQEIKNKIPSGMTDRALVIDGMAKRLASIDLKNYDKMIGRTQEKDLLVDGSNGINYFELHDARASRWHSRIEKILTVQKSRWRSRIEAILMRLKPPV